MASSESQIRQHQSSAGSAHTVWVYPQGLRGRPLAGKALSYPLEILFHSRYSLDCKALCLAAPSSWDFAHASSTFSYWIHPGLPVYGRWRTWLFHHLVFQHKLLRVVLLQSIWCTLSWGLWTERGQWPGGLLLGWNRSVFQGSEGGP